MENNIHQNNIQIFSDPVFGNIRTMTIDGAPWFVGKDVADALGYERADNVIRQRVDSEDKLMHQISASGQMRNMTLINESGLYALIFGSKLESAQRFKRWVTSEVLPAIRKTGSYNAPVPMTVPEQIQLLAMGNVELTQKVDSLDKKIDRLELDLPILGVEIDRITSAVHKKGVECLGGKYSEAYRDRSLRGKVYADIYAELKLHFGVGSYKSIKRSQCDLAVSIIDGYQLPFGLKDMVQYRNAQLGLWGGSAL